MSTNRFRTDDREALRPKIAERELGRGRSGVVFLSRDESGRKVARKVFGSNGLTKAVQYAFLGAPNPYLWSEPAIRTAVLRRSILAELVEFWFGAKLRVARAYDYAWNAEFRAFEMPCELIEGCHVALHHPYTAPDHAELKDVIRNVMKPLQKRLAEAGCDGLVWQAGRGNPVALNNFMCEGRDDCDGYRWAWIDLESGVPALIPINPLDLLVFYLPKSLLLRRPLFDDVDVDKLRRYVGAQRERLEEKLGDDRVSRLETDIDALAERQREWKSLPRHRRSISYRFAKGSISQEQAERYAKHPWRWYGRESVRAMRSMTMLVVSGACRLVAALAGFNLGRALKGCWNAVRSQEYRERLARDYVATRLAHWRGRGQLSEGDAALLRGHLDSDEGSTSLADFGIHLAVKPLVKVTQLWIMPALWVAGAVDDVFLGFFLVAGGSIVRTLYTLARLIQSARLGHEKPWVALLVGAFPVIGNFAYPTQMFATGTHEHREVAGFILYDTFAGFGRWLPIFFGGGPTP